MSLFKGKTSQAAGRAGGSRRGPSCLFFFRARSREDYCRNAVQVSRRAGERARRRDLVSKRRDGRWVYATIIPARGSPSLAQLQIPSIPSQIPDGEIAMRPQSAFMGKHGWTNCAIAIRPTKTVVLDRGCVASKCDRYYARSCRRLS